MSDNDKDTKVIDEEEYNIEEEKYRSATGLLRQESEFYDEESNVVHELISVKRVRLPKNGEDWQIHKDKKPILILKGARFTSKERDFLRSIDGVKFILSGFKAGWRSISEFKRQIKNKK